MIGDRTTETATGRLRALLNERDAEWKQGMAWNVTVINGDWLVVEDVDFGTLSVSTMAYMLTPEQAIAAMLGSEREAKLIRAMEDVLRHSTDTVWVGEAETLVDRMVSLGVYKHDVYEGVRPWEATNER